MEIDLTPRDESVTVSVDVERLHEALGEQGILGEDVEGTEFFYLSALALECREAEDYSATDVVMEYIRNSSEFEHVTREAADDIENLLK